MASGLAKSGKMKRMESKKSHSWWWDSHITPKNNKWLQDNLEEMDELVKRMLKLIEEDADSFAKKAELYFKKRPELVNLVEEFYRMYRALAERYDLVSGELRKTIPSDLQSQGSGISDAASEPPLSTQSLELRPRRTKSGHSSHNTKSRPRAAGFDYFLGSGTEANSKEGNNASTLDSESESKSESGSESESDDDSSVDNSMRSNGEENALQRRVVELEAELEELRQKLKMQEEAICENCKKYNSESLEVSKRIAAYEEELRVVEEKFQQSEEEIAHLSMELQKYTSSEVFEASTAVEPNHAQESADRATGEVMQKSQALEEELRMTREKLHTSEKEVSSLRQELTSMVEQLKSAHNEVSGWKDKLNRENEEVSVWKDKLNRENEEVSKLQDRVVRYKMNLADRDQEIRALREAMLNANKSLSEANEQLQAEITRMMKERTYLEDNLKELDLRCQSVEEEARRATAAKGEMEVMFGNQIQQLKEEITARENCVEEVNKMLNELELKHDALVAIRDELNVKITALTAEISSKDNQIAQMGSHLHQLHMQHVELIAAAEGARKQAGELQNRVKELEIEVQRKQETINESAERKREAIRQLCFSLEHYRSGYHQLRQAVIAHKRPTVMAT